MDMSTVLNDSIGERSLALEAFVAGRPTLREKRLERAMSMNELADAAGVSASTVMDIERTGASPRMATIRKLANALDCAPQDIAWPGDPFGELETPGSE